MKFFLVYGSIFWFCYHAYVTKNLRSCPWIVYIWSFHWVMVIYTYFCTKGYDYVKRFVRVLVLLVINTGCPKNLLKMGNTALLISSSNYAKTPYKCVHRRRFVFLVFWQFFWNTLYEGWFWCKDFPRLMNEGRFPQVGDSIFFCLPRFYLYLRGTAFYGLFTWSWDSSLLRGNSLTPGSTLPRCMVWRL